MNVLAKLESTLVFIGTSYVSSVILLHKLIAGLVNQISEELEPNKCIVHGKTGAYVLFNTNYVNYIYISMRAVLLNLSNTSLYNINFVTMVKYITCMHTNIIYQSHDYVLLVMNI